MIELDDDARHECDGVDWKDDTKNLLWLLSAFIYMRVNDLEPGTNRNSLERRFAGLISWADQEGYQ